MEAERELVLRFLETHAGEAAALLERDPTAAAALLADACPAAIGGEVLRRMTPAAAAECVAQLEPQLAVGFIEGLPVDRLGLIARSLDGERADALMAALPPDTAEALRRLLRHRPGTAGAVMDPTVLAIPADVSAEEALQRLRENPARSTYYLYVIDRDARLVGVLTTRDLMLAVPDHPIAEAMTHSVATLDADAQRASILGHGAWRAHPMLPVVDAAGHFLGAVRYETLRRLEQEHRGPSVARGAAPALNLAELIWLGLSNVVDELGGAAERARRSDDGTGSG